MLTETSQHLSLNISQIKESNGRFIGHHYLEVLHQIDYVWRLLGTVKFAVGSDLLHPTIVWGHSVKDSCIYVLMQILQGLPFICKSIMSREVEYFLGTIQDPYLD